MFSAIDCTCVERRGCGRVEGLLELGRAYIAIPLPPGYKAVTKDGIPVDGWPCKDLKWDGDEATFEFPDEITIVKVVN